MKRLIVFVFFGLAWLTNVAHADQPAPTFVAVDVVLQSDAPIAAWQFEFGSEYDAIQIVGVEQGDSAAFGDAPYYDREAVRQGTADHIIVADYSLANEDELPRGGFRLATLHLMISGALTQEFEITLITAVNAGGERVDASISTALQIVNKPGSES